MQIQKISKLFDLLKSVSKEVPQLQIAWGLLFLALVAAIISQLLGQTRFSLIALGLTFVGVILTAVVAAAVKDENIPQVIPKLLTWGITLVALSFMFFTVSAFAFSWPCNWAIFIGISNSRCSFVEGRHMKPLSPKVGDFTESFTEEFNSNTKGWQKITLQ
jgi:hypothetical protein